MPSSRTRRQASGGAMRSFPIPSRGNAAQSFKFWSPVPCLSVDPRTLCSARGASRWKRPRPAPKRDSRRRAVPLAHPRCPRVAQFMLIVDLTVLNVALPSIASDRRLDRVALTWSRRSNPLLRCAIAAQRPPGTRLRPAPNLPHRARRLHRGLTGIRAGSGRSDPDRRPHRSGDRGRAAVASGTINHPPSRDAPASKPSPSGAR